MQIFPTYIVQQLLKKIPMVIFHIHSINYENVKNNRMDFNATVNILIMVKLAWKEQHELHKLSQQCCILYSIPGPDLPTQIKAGDPLLSTPIATLTLPSSFPYTALHGTYLFQRASSGVLTQVERFWPFN